MPLLYVYAYRGERPKVSLAGQTHVHRMTNNSAFYQWINPAGRRIVRHRKLLSAE
jgi:hypothetical protein